MSGLIRQHQLAPGAALNRRQMRELFYQAAQHLAAVRHESLGNDIFEHGDFQDSAFEDYYFNYIAGSTYELPPGNLLPPGSFETIDTQDNQVEATVAWSLWVEMRAASCKMVCAWPMVGNTPLWGLACLRQAGAVTVYNTGAILPGPAYDDKIAWGGGWAIGDDVCLGGSGVAILPRGTRLPVGLMLMTLGGTYKVRQAAIQVTRRAG